jgi:hypothetical protein
MELVFFEPQKNQKARGCVKSQIPTGFTRFKGFY